MCVHACVTHPRSRLPVTRRAVMHRLEACTDIHKFAYVHTHTQYDPYPDASIPSTHLAVSQRALVTTVTLPRLAPAVLTVCVMSVASMITAASASGTDMPSTSCPHAWKGKRPKRPLASAQPQPHLACWWLCAGLVPSRLVRCRSLGSESSLMPSWLRIGLR